MSDTLHEPGGMSDALDDAVALCEAESAQADEIMRALREERGRIQSRSDALPSPLVTLLASFYF